MQYESPAELFERVRAVLQDILDTENMKHLREQLAATDGLRYELSQARAKLHFRLMLDRDRARVPKSSEHTDLDRKVMMEANTAELEQDYEFLLQLETIVTDRIQLGITLLQTM